MIHLASTLSDDLGEAAGLVLSYLLPEWRPKAGGGKRAAGEAEAGQAAAAQEEEQERMRRHVLRIQARFRGRRERKRVDARRQQIEAREAERWAQPAPRPGSAPSGAVPTQLALARLRAGGGKARFIASMARAVPRPESSGPSTQRTTPVDSSGGGPASKTARTITFSEPPAPPGGGARGAPSPRARSMQQQSWTSGRLSLTDPGMA